MSTQTRLGGRWNLLLWRNRICTSAIASPFRTHFCRSSLASFIKGPKILNSLPASLLSSMSIQILILLSLYTSYWIIGAKKLLVSIKFILCDQSLNSCDQTVVWSVDITMRKLILITEKGLAISSWKLVLFLLHEVCLSIVIIKI